MKERKGVKGREPSHNSFRYLSGIEKNSTRGGNVATGNMLVQRRKKLALFQNMGDPEYRKIVFGSLDIGAVFAKHRKPFRKEGMTRKRVMELVDSGTEKILGKSLPELPYTGEMMSFAYSSRNEQPKPI